MLACVPLIAIAANRKEAIHQGALGERDLSEDGGRVYRTAPGGSITRQPHPGLSLPASCVERVFLDRQPVLLRHLLQRDLRPRADVPDHFGRGKRPKTSGHLVPDAAREPK